MVTHWKVPRNASISSSAVSFMRRCWIGKRHCGSGELVKSQQFLGHSLEAAGNLLVDLALLLACL